MLSDLKIGQSAVLEHFMDEYTAVRCMELGCLPGETIRLEQFAPPGDPLCISFNGTQLSMRLKDAGQIIVRKGEEPK